MRWVRHVAGKEGKEAPTGFWWGLWMEGDPLEELDLVGRIILSLRLLMSYIYIYVYGAPILDVSRSHTTTQHSR